MMAQLSPWKLVKWTLTRGGWQAGTAVGAAHWSKAAGGDVSPVGRQRFQRLCCCRSLPHFAGQSPSFCLFCHRTPCQISSLLTISWSVSRQVFVRRSIHPDFFTGAQDHIAFQMTVVLVCDTQVLRFAYYIQVTKLRCTFGTVFLSLSLFF